MLETKNIFRNLLTSGSWKRLLCAPDRNAGDSYNRVSSALILLARTDESRMSTSPDAPEIGVRIKLG